MKHLANVSQVANVIDIKISEHTVNLLKKALIGCVIAAPAFGVGYIAGTGESGGAGLQVPFFTDSPVEMPQTSARPIFPNTSDKRVERLLQDISRQAKKHSQENADPQAPVAVQDLIDKVQVVPDAMINHYLADLFGNDILNSITDPKKFSTRLIEVASNIDIEEASEPESSQARLSFSQSPVYGQRYLTGSDNINQYDAIFSHVATLNGAQLTDVFVKWYSHQTGAMLMLDKVRLEADSNGSAFFSTAPKTGWAPGTYTVNVYSADDSLSLLASGHYDIGEVISQKQRSTINQQAINDLLAAGKAQSKVKAN